MENERRWRGVLSTEVTKMRKGLKRFGLGLVAQWLSVALLLTAAVPVSQARPDEKVVKIGLYAVFTGALATTGRGQVGYSDYVRYINEQGGINGVELEVIWEETGTAPVPRAIIAHRRFKAAGVVAAWSWLSLQAIALAPSLVRDEIPIIGGTGLEGGMITCPLQWIFAGGPSVGDESAAAIDYFVDNWFEERPLMVGCIFYDHTSGWQCLEGIKWSAEYRDNVEYVGHEVVPMLGTIDTTTEWLRLAGKKPDLIMVTTCGATLATVVKDAARLDVQKRGIKLCHTQWCLDDSLQAGVIREEAEGWYNERIAASIWEEGIPGQELIFALTKKYRGWERTDLVPCYPSCAWAVAVVTAEAIRFAIENVGYENLDGRAVRDALFGGGIRGIDVGGILPPITMSEKKPYLASGSRMYQVRQQKILPVSDQWYEFPGVMEFD